MTRYLVATASERVTEAACDYLADRVEPGDSVDVLTVDDGADDDRDAALAVVQGRLSVAVEVRTFRRRGRPDREIVAFARDRDVDEIIVGPRRGTGYSTIGTTTRAVLNKVDKPVFVVPLEER